MSRQLLRKNLGNNNSLFITQEVQVDIYSFPTFNLTKILLTAEEAGVEYKLHLIDPQKGEHKSPEHLARHPLGKVPAVEIDGQSYFESNAICRLIADKYAPQLIGDTPEQRALVNQWIDFMALHIGQWLQVVFFEEKIGPAFFRKETSQSAIEEAKNFLKEQLPVLNAQLQKQEYLVGSSPMLADFVAVSYFETVELCSVDISDFSAIRSWMDRMLARRSYSKAMSLMPGGSTFAWMRVTK